MYQVYSISTPDNKYRYYGTTKSFASRISLHVSRFNGNHPYGSNCFIYEVLRSKVKNFRDCKIEVLRNFKNKADALRMEQRLIEKDGNLNSYNAINE